MKPVFSIIIATYNSDKYLARTLESVINQNFLDYELIIIDGGSKDGTLAIIEHYKSKIALVISEKDDGIYDAWNKGVKFSKGTWLMFIGSDDVLHQGALDAYAIFIQESGGNFNYISSRVNLVKNNGKIIREIGKPWRWENFKKYMCVAHVGSLHHKTLYEDFGLYNIDYKITGDYELLLRARNKLRAGFLNVITVSMQIGGVSVGRNSFSETYNAKVTTGRRNKLIAQMEMMEAKIKYRIRSFLSLK
ncbi:MAG: glycosyltransferase family 2 protein [Bacteroidota bacterium]